MGDYATKYTFKLIIDGFDASEQAKTFGKRIREALDVNLGSELDKQLGSLTTQVNALSKAFESLAPKVKEYQSLAQQAVTGTKGFSQSTQAVVNNLQSVQASATQANQSLKQMVATQESGFQRYMTLEQSRQGWMQQNQGPWASGTLDMSASPTPTGMAAFTQGMADAQREMWGLRRGAYDIQAIGGQMTRNALVWAAGMTLVAKSYVDFNDASTRAGIAMRLEADMHDDLQQAIMETAEATGRFSTTEIAEGLRIWVAGTGEVITNQEQLQKVIKDTTQIQQLAALNNVELGGTMDAVGGIMYEFGMNTGDVTHIVETLNYVSSESFANVTDLGNAFKMVGPIAYSMGISFEQTAAALALLSNQNIKGTMAGRAFRQMLINMNDPSAEYSKVMNEALGTTTGVSDAWKEIVYPGGAFMGLPEYIDLLAERTANLSERQRTERLSALATANSLPTLTALVLQQAKAREYGVNVLSAYEKVMNGVTDAEVLNYKKYYEAATGVKFTQEGASARMTGMWEEYTESDAYKVQVMQRKWENVFIKLGEAVTTGVLPSVEKLVDAISKLADYLNDHPGWANFLGWTVATNLFLGSVLTRTGQVTVAFTTLKGIMGAVDAMKAGAAAASTRAITEAALLEGASVGTAARMAAGGGVVGTISGAIASLGGTTAIAMALIPIAGAVVAAVALNLAAKEANKEETAAAERRAETYPEDIKKRFDELFKLSPTDGGYLPRDRAAEQFMVDTLGTNLSPGMMYSQRLVLSGENLAQVFEELERQAKYAAMALTDTERAAMAAELGYEMGTLKGRIPIAPAIASYTTPEGGYTEERQGQLLQYYQYTQDRASIELQFQQERKALEDNYAAYVTQAQSNLTKQLADMAATYTKDNTRREEDYQASLGDLAADHAKQREQAQKQHLSNLAKMQLAHRDRMIDLLEARDVEGLTKEMRSFARQEEEAKSSYAEQQAERDADYAERLRKEEEVYAKENAQRKEDYDEKMADLRENTAAEIAERGAQLALSLQQSRENEQAQLEQLAEDLYVSITGIENMLADHYDKLNKDLETFEEKYTSTWDKIAKNIYGFFWFAGNLPERWQQVAESGQMGPYSTDNPATYSRASGGYVSRGQYLLGEQGREFVLNANTTRSLEDRWGYLSQDSFRSSGETVFAPVFNGMGAQDRAWYLEAARKVFDDGMREQARRLGR